MMLEQDGCCGELLHGDEVHKMDDSTAVAHDAQEDFSKEEKTFLQMVHDPVSRQHLLAHLEQLGLLSAFLEAENGTI